MKSLLKSKLYLLHLLYFLCNMLSNLKIANKFFVYYKIYFGTGIISLSLFIASCDHRESKNNNTDSTFVLKKITSKDTVTPRFIPIKKSMNDPFYVVIDSTPIITCYVEVMPEPTIDSLPDLTYDPKVIIEREDTLTSTEQMPEFKGGTEKLNQFLSENLKYSGDTLNKSISENVVVEFVINKDGEIIHPQIIRSLHPSLDDEVLRVVNLMPKWIPGKHNGIPVNVRYTLPVSFVLEK